MRSAELGPVIFEELGDAETLVRSASFAEPVGRRPFTAAGELAGRVG